MRRYSGFTLTIDSELELPELPPGEGEPDLTIRIGRVPRNGSLATLEDEITHNTLAGGFHLRNGNEIVVDPMAGVDAGTLRLVLLGRIMAFLLRQRGWLSLHASGILIDGKGVLFAGASGAGKSTTAAAFHAHGHMVITDDVAAVRVVDGHCVVLPAWPRLRLLDDSRVVLRGRERRVEFQIDKHSIDLGHGGWRRPLELRRIYLLENGVEFGSEPIAAVPAVALLSLNAFVRRRRMTPEALTAHMRDCASVGQAAQVHRLVRPLKFDLLPDLVRFVEENLRGG